MPITQIPFQDPVAPPDKPQPEQLGLYDTRDWETAYRELDAAVPHLLIQLQDDLARSRKREAAWISIIAHLLLAILLFSPLFDMLQKAVGWHSVVVVPLNTEDKNATFLALPPDLQKARRPNTNVLSDKDRIATSRHPELDPKELRKILASPPPGAPGPQGPRMAQPASPPPQAMAQQAQQQPTQRPQFQTNQTAELQMPPQPNNSFSKYAGGMSAGEAIQQAAQAAAARRAAGVGSGGQEGDFGLGTGGHDRRVGGIEILSDTQGVDFGPYLTRIIHDVQQNWERLMPESVLMGKKGKLTIEFAITKDGQVAAMKVTVPSGDTALDRAAWGGITASNPFPPLPTEFTGPYLELRFRFYYNPDKADLD